MMYRECPLCGLNLDPGEKCDCRKKERGRPAGTGTTSNNELPYAVYQLIGKKSSCAVAPGRKELLHENQIPTP